MTHQAQALNWLIETLERHHTDYQIVGGLAAIAYGCTRPLADIDLYIPYRAAEAFLADIKPYIYWGPEHQTDEHWDITYMKLTYENQKIEIGDSENARIFDTRTGQWKPQAIDYTASTRKTALGCAMNVMPLAQLIDYKSALARDIDIEDIRQISS